MVAEKLPVLNFIPDPIPNSVVTAGKFSMNRFAPFLHPIVEGHNPGPGATGPPIFNNSLQTIVRGLPSDTISEHVWKEAVR